MKRSIFAAFLTTVSRKQAFHALCLLLQPWKWNAKQPILDLQIAFSTYLLGDDALVKENRTVPFYNARSALKHGLSYLGISDWDKVVVQAYTCVSVINAILAAWWVPCYVDIDESTLNMNVEDLEKKLQSEKISVVVVQHTLGMVADMKLIASLCQQYDCSILEDCAHSLGAAYQWKKAWLRWDVSIFSFGRDKIISSVNWWMLLINQKNETHNEWLDALTLRSVSHLVMIRNLLYAIVWYISYVLYDLARIWKIFYRMAGKMKLFPTIVSLEEKQCIYTDLSFSLPSPLASLALQQIQYIDLHNAARKVHTQQLYSCLWDNIVYRDSTDFFDVYLRCVLLLSEKKRPLVEKMLKDNNIFPGDWYQRVIAPHWVLLQDVGYTPWECPVAERIASMTINLPNHYKMTEKDVFMIVSLLKE